MKQDRIVFRSTFRHPSAFRDQTTTVSFIPVCDSCNYAFDRASGQVGNPYVEPYVCPNCKKIVDCIRLPHLDAEGRLNYEED